MNSEHFEHAFRVRISEKFCSAPRTLHIIEKFTSTMTSTSSEVYDINDAFDSIVFSEDKIVRKGFSEGIKKGITEAEAEGYHLGFHKGVEFGYELGYYEGVTNYFLHSVDSKTIEFPEKVFQILIKIKTLISNYPRVNCSNTDIVGLKSEIKSLFRRLCSLLKFDGLLAEESISF